MLNNMKKIKKLIIHFLGGVTKEELKEKLENVTSKSNESLEKCRVEKKKKELEAVVDICRDILAYADSIYGTNADDWCKEVYNYIDETEKSFVLELHRSYLYLKNEGEQE